MNRRLLNLLQDAASANDIRLVEFAGVPTFRISSQIGIRLASAIGDPFHPYPDQLQPILATSDGLTRAINAAAEADADILRLRYLPENIPDQTILPRKTQIVTHGTCVADLNQVFEVLEINELVRKRTKWIQLQRDFGSISFKVVHDVIDRENLIHTLIDWKREWFAEQGIRALGFNEPFHIDCLKNSANSNLAEVVRIHALFAGETPIATEVCIAVEDTIYNVIIAGNPKFRSFGPGVLLSKLALQQATLEGFSQVDFLPPASEHKRSMAKKSVAKIELRVPLTLKGQLALRVMDLATSVRGRVKPSKM